MRRYKLHYADGSHEYVDAEGPTQAVAARTWGRKSEQPHTITDMTAMAEWVMRGLAATPYIPLAPARTEPTRFESPLTWLERMKQK